MKKYVLFSSLVLIAATGTVQAAEEQEWTIGRWCDAGVADGAGDNRLVAIMYKEPETYFSRITDSSGEQTEDVLSLLPGDIYVREGNVYGERLRVHRSTENLQLMDNDGVKATYTKLENEPQPGDCLEG